MTTPRRILLTSQMVLASRVVSAVLQAVLLGLFARSVAPGTFALTTTAVATLMALTALTDAGLQPLAQRTAAGHPTTGKAAAIIKSHDSLQLTAGIAVTLLGILATAREILPAHLLLLGAWFVLEKIASARSSLSISYDRPIPAATNIIIRRAAALLLFWALIYTPLAPEQGYVIALTASSGLGVLHSLTTVRVPFSIGIPNRSHVVEAKYLWTTSLGLRLRNFDSTVALALLGSAGSAHFVAVARLAGPLRMLVSAVATALLPAAAKSRERSKEIHWTVLGTLLLQLAGFTVCAVFAESVLYIALGSQYTGAADLLRIYLVGLWFASACDLYSAVLQGLGKERATSGVAWWTSLLALAGLGAGGILAGGEGAAAGVSGAYFVHFIVLYRHYQRAATQRASE